MDIFRQAGVAIKGVAWKQWICTQLRYESFRFLPQATQDHTSEQEDGLMVVKSMGMALAWHKLPGQKRMLELKQRRAFFSRGI